MQQLNTDFWKERYDNQQTGWDLGEVSPPLKAYFDQLEDKSIRILIPGAGNAHEATYLHQLGFENVFVVDLVQNVLDEFALKNPSFDKNHLICSDFFDLKGDVDAAQFDLIIEQTFFCAIDPSLRKEYPKKMKELLAENGKLVGLLFSREFEGGPPFGGSKDEYLTYFQTYFTEIKMVECYNSIAPRAGSELFFVCKKA